MPGAAGASGKGRRRGQRHGAAPVELGQRAAGAAQAALALGIGPVQPVTHPFRQGAAAEGGLLTHGVRNALA